MIIAKELEKKENLESLLLADFYILLEELKKMVFFKVGLAWTRMAFYTFFNRKIKNLKIKYDFGKF